MCFPCLDQRDSWWVLHTLLCGGVPQTCLSYVASMDTLPSWQRTGKFSPSTQKEKEETTFSFWDPCSTIASTFLPRISGVLSRKKSNPSSLNG